MDPILIVGAGPTGLMTAGEIALSGIPCRIIERRRDRSPWSRAFGLHSRSLELLDARGLGETFLARGYPSPHLVTDAGTVDLHRLPSRYPMLLMIPQNETERILEEYVRGLGVDIERPYEAVEVRQDDEGVDVVVADESGRRHTERATYVVAADGGQSTVRRRLGLPFNGSSYGLSAMLGDVRIARPPGEGMQILSTPRGMVLTSPFNNGLHRLITIDNSVRDLPASTPLSLEDLRASARRILGYELGVSEPSWLSRFTSDWRQMDRYREGRVFFAGDAAHVHSPAAGQGLNTSLQDAFNLGWKLAAAVRGGGMDRLLDSYNNERHPIGTRVLQYSDMFLRAMSVRNPALWAVRRAALRALLTVPARRRALREGVSAIAYRYAPPSGVPTDDLSCTRVPEMSLVRADGSQIRVYELLRQGRHLLVYTSGMGYDDEAASWERAVEPWSDRVTFVCARFARGAPKWRKLMLIRPDAYFAATTDTPSEAWLKAVTRFWVGETAATVRQPAKA